MKIANSKWQIRYVACNNTWEMDMREYVIFKGSRNGLQLMFDESAAFDVILENLKAKLESAVDFFTKGTKVEVPAQIRVLTSEEQADLNKLLLSHGLVFYEVDGQGENNSKQPVLEPEIIQTLVVAKTIRSGQEIIHPGSVMIEGDVNPGAEIIAGGNIVVNGTCRGLVHAGAYGDSTATITAQRLLASQIRIAGLISRAPDHLDQPNQAEIALVENGIVMIKSANAEDGVKKLQL